MVAPVNPMVLCGMCLGEAHLRLGSGTYSAVFGPACSQVCRSVGRLAAFLNLPVFSGVCQGTEMDNKADFKVSPG